MDFNAIPESRADVNGFLEAGLNMPIARFKPDAAIDMVLQACHSYNIESYRVGENVQEKHGLPFLKIVTDYSQGDLGQIRTRVEALLETISEPLIDK